MVTGSTIKRNGLVEVHQQPGTPYLYSKKAVLFQSKPPYEIFSQSFGKFVSTVGEAGKAKSAILTNETLMDTSVISYDEVKSQVLSYFALELKSEP
ncbi:hypothetical protein STEG23_014292, partial [Scotinomys teguina]